MPYKVSVMLSGLLGAAVVFAASTLAQQPAATSRASTAPAALAHPATPGIFAVGLTDITDTSARLVFTTSDSMQATIVVEGPVGAAASSRRIAETQPADIHRHTVDGLVKGGQYTLKISAALDGVDAKPATIKLTATPRPAKFDTFNGRTLFDAAHGDNRVDLLRELGAGVHRMESSWDGLEPKRGQFDQNRVAKLVKQARELKEANIEPLVVLNYCVPWAKTYTDYQMRWRNKAFGPPDDLQDWREYVQKVMTELKGIARYYEVWNEPDAGYLATGVFVERPNLPGPVILREAFRDNIPYWIGDRYAPMVMAVREVADEVDKDISVIGGSWNRDYGGSRGRICFDHGMQNYIQQYSFHNYVSAPHTYAAWETASGFFFKNALANFKDHNVDMPIAITEWGMQTYDQRPEKLPGGAWTQADGQAFMAKSVFFYLGMERVSMLVLHQMGFNDDWSLINKDPNTDSLSYQPMYGTYRWICHTFNNRPYKRLELTADPGDDVRAYAIHMGDDGSTYVAVWQDRYDAQEKKVIPLPARKCSLELRGLPAGAYTAQRLDLTGQVLETLHWQAKDSLKFDAALQATDANSETPPMLYRLAPEKSAAR